jgi:dTMP kinase
MSGASLPVPSGTSRRPDQGPIVRYTPTVAGARTASERGAFITIDGPEGGGKTTQAKRLAAHLSTLLPSVHLTREPGGTWLGERLREVLLARTGSAAPTDPLTDALVFNAARRQLVREVIRPALEAGTTVVCARFADSTLAYQGYGAGVPLDLLRSLAATATDSLVPDLTILLDVPIEIGLARKAPGDVTRFEAEYDLAFHQRVRDGFLAIAAAEPDRVAVVDASDHLAAVSASIVDIVNRRLAIGEPPAPRVRTT